MFERQTPFLSFFPIVKGVQVQFKRPPQSREYCELCDIGSLQYTNYNRLRPSGEPRSAIDTFSFEGVADTGNKVVVVCLTERLSIVVWSSKFGRNYIRGKNLEASPINICRKGNKYPAHPTMTTAATNTGDVTGFGDVLVYRRRNLK